MTPVLKNRKWRRRLLGIGLGLLIGLLLAEGLLRVLGYSPAHVNPLRAFHCADPVLVYRGRPNVEGRFRREQFDVAIRHGPRGFRMPEFSRDPGTTDGTVHVFGDSFTWGWGVETGEVLTDKLRHALPGHAVHNYGINASGTALQVKLFESEVAADVAPGDRVVLMFFYNDFFDNTHATRLHGRVEGDRVVEVTPESDFGPSFGIWLKEHSYLANFGAHVWDLQKANRHAMAQREAADPRGPGPTAEHIRVTGHFLSRFRGLCDERKAELTVVWVPDSRDVKARAAGQPSTFFAAFLAMTQALGITVFDPTDAFVAAGTTEAALYFDGDEHWTPAGHALIGELLAARFRP